MNGSSTDTTPIRPCRVLPTLRLAATCPRTWDLGAAYAQIFGPAVKITVPDFVLSPGCDRRQCICDNDGIRSVYLPPWRRRAALPVLKPIVQTIWESRYFVAR